MFELVLAFIAGLVVAAISPPIYRFTVAKVAQFRAWMLKSED